LSVLVDDHGVFRNAIKEHRPSYFVSYQPADARYSFALIQLTFLDEQTDVAQVKRAVEYELNYWIRRYSLPVIASAFDAKEDLIEISPEYRQSFLMGFADNKTGDVLSRWGGYENEELPAEQMTAEYQARVYEGVPFRLRSQVRREALDHALKMGRGIRVAMFFLVGVPVLIEIISLGVDWLGYFLASISISVGIYKLGKTMSWWKPTKREREAEEKDRKMKHYYYHCELNPDDFNRLRNKNFVRESIRNTQEESERLRQSGLNGN
jgi:hypothetical protein